MTNKGHEMDPALHDDQYWKGVIDTKLEALTGSVGRIEKAIDDLRSEVASFGKFKNRVYGALVLASTPLAVSLLLRWWGK